MKKLTVLTGAGISQESGLATFRDAKDGLWMGYDINEVASVEGWKKDKAKVLGFYNMRKREADKAEPNAAHIGLAKLQEHFDVTVITQNVDTLHERAGSRKVIHLHGQLDKKRTTYKDIVVDWPVGEEIKVGDKGEDGSQYRPHIVWFGENVPMLTTAEVYTYDADIFVVIGTSLQVYPAAGLLNRVRVYDKVPIFILDKSIPDLSGFVHVNRVTGTLIDFEQQTIGIKKSAVEGIVELVEELLKLK